MPPGDDNLAKGFIDLIKATVRRELYEREQVVEDPLSRVGRPWTPEEDEQLQREISAAASIIASIHRRKPGAITSRVRQMMEHTGRFRD